MRTLLSAALLSILTACANEAISEPRSTKLHPSNPFVGTATQSQFFTIQGEEDNVVEGAEGTFLYIPEEAFLFEDGTPASGDIELELAEALSLQEMILSNLTTTSDGKLLETDGMLYLSATSDGKQLKIDPENPVYIEVPTDQRKPGMMAYEGVRDQDGNMNWVNPKEIENYLVTVDMELLNFLPDGFSEAVAKGLPFRKHEVLSGRLIDSLYYSLSESDGSQLTEGFVATDYNEPYDNENTKVENGQYTEESFTYYNEETQREESYDTTISADTASPCGINPAIIKAIRTEQFQNSLIATREFETRLQDIFQTCRKGVLEYYIKNSEKQLWELDSAAASKLEGTKHQQVFETYAAQKLTNVRDADKHAFMIRKHYEKNLGKIKKELKRLQEKAEQQLQKKNEVAQEVANDYKDLLLERESYRMERYGFQWTQTGWLNIDRGTQPKDWGPQKLEVTVVLQEPLEQVYTYIYYSSIQSLYRLNTDDQRAFHVGNSSERQMLMPKLKPSVIISVAYDDNEGYFATKNWITGSTESVQMSPEKMSLETIKQKIAAFDSTQPENQIAKDIEYMQFFATEKKRQEKLHEERRFIQSLLNIASPCCAEEVDGRVLFSQNCRSCHRIHMKSIDPKLEGVTSKHSKEWLIAFTKNSTKLVRNGDVKATRIYNEYNGSIMETFENLSDEQIIAIYDYIDSESVAQKSNYKWN